ncbi:MAG: glycosyltransferase, partial [Actinomycetota bacterium]|nr:glycosyltransferase [Actinomycetota bacterium]
PYRNRLEESIRAQGLDGRVRFVDPKGQVPELVAGLDIFAMPSVPRSEGMPTAILEAMASGIPIVATRVGATDELVRDGVTGILVPPEDPRALADAIARLLEDPDLREAYGKAARRDALERFDLTRLAKRHADAYRMAIEHRDRTPPRQPEEHDVLERERAFFDEGAGDLNPSQMPPREYEPYESRFEDALIERIGEPKGKRILDLGCGTGDLTLRLLQRGAAVTALDLSPAAVGVAKDRAQLFVPEAEARFVVGTAEETGLADGEFDFVVGKLVLHHLDLSRAASEVRRVLKPGGGAAFIETSGYNPVLRAARRHLPGRAGIARYGTSDEHPLTPADVELVGRHFSRAEVDFPVMVFAYLIERHVLRWRFGGTQRLLAGIDLRLAKNARARRGSYYLRLTLER